MVDLLKLAPGFCFNLYSKSSDIESLEIDFGIKMFKTSFQSMSFLPVSFKFEKTMNTMFEYDMIYFLGY